MCVCICVCVLAEGFRISQVFSPQSDNLRAWVFACNEMYCMSVITVYRSLFMRSGHQIWKTLSSYSSPHAPQANYFLNNCGRFFPSRAKECDELQMSAVSHKNNSWFQKEKRNMTKKRGLWWCDRAGQMSLCSLVNKVCESIQGQGLGD